MKDDAMTALPPPEEIERLADDPRSLKWFGEPNIGGDSHAAWVMDVQAILRALAALQRADVGGESAEEFARRLRETTWAYRAIREFVMSDEDAVAAVALRGTVASLRCAALEMAWRAYIDEFGVEHLDGCPEDDTCDCQHVIQLNALLRSGK